MPRSPAASGRNFCGGRQAKASGKHRRLYLAAKDLIHRSWVRSSSLVFELRARPCTNVHGEFRITRAQDDDPSGRAAAAGAISAPGLRLRRRGGPTLTPGRRDPAPSHALLSSTGSPRSRPTWNPLTESALRHQPEAAPRREHLGDLGGQLWRGHHSHARHRRSPGPVINVCPAWPPLHELPSWREPRHIVSRCPAWGSQSACAQVRFRSSSMQRSSCL